MTDRLHAGPYRNLQLDQTVQAPWYMIPFDERGRCEAPLTRDHLLGDLQSTDYTDVFLFSHGWNNDWATATKTYENFISGYAAMQRTRTLAYPRAFRPLLIGVTWPSTALVMPWESGPSFAANAGDDAERTDAAVAAELQQIRALAGAVAEEDRARFYGLAQREGDLTPNEALELAQILLPIYQTVRDELPPKVSETFTSAELLALWFATASKAASPDATGAFGFADEAALTPEAAGVLRFLDARTIIRLATVLEMKDRAGSVGAYGVATLLSDLLTERDEPRFHLIGHSYGCKVVLSAISFRPLLRPVNSLLLLQPAISYYCFAEDATGTGEPGGYRVALERVEQPILTTFSPRDVPLTQFFHLAVRRKSDIGEMRIAGAPPSRYAALGGYGPGGCDADSRAVAMKEVGEYYDLGVNAPKIWALNGAQAIYGHGDISNTFTWWALYNQVIS